MDKLLCLLCFVASVHGYCWKPHTSPFYGPPKVNRIGSERAKVEWANVFNDGPDCSEVDFLIMTYPKENPSSYQLSDFTLKGQRSAVLKVGVGQDYVFQVIARENKGERYGIDYKYSDMVTSYADDGSNNLNENRERAKSTISTTTKTTTTTTTTTTTSTTTGERSYLPPPTRALPGSYSYDDDLYDNYDDLDGEESIETNPWYIYECVPFLKDLSGYADNAGEASHNKLLVDFIRQMNLKPIGMVEEFLIKQKQSSCHPQSSDQLASAPDARMSKGYVTKCSDGSKSMCCSTPWDTNCGSNNCFLDYSSCDGGRCVPGQWIADGWPDCLDGADESSMGDKSLPRQLVCVQCAGVVLSTGFICRESSQGLTKQCMTEIMGDGGACNDCVNQYLNLP